MNLRRVKDPRPKTQDPIFYTNFAQAWKTKNGKKKKKEEKILGMMKIHWWYCFDHFSNIVRVQGVMDCATEKQGKEKHTLQLHAS